VCVVRRDVCRKLNNKSVTSFTKILFIMPVLKLRRRTVYNQLQQKGTTALCSIQVPTCWICLPKIWIISLKKY
jgi:hypothetical protein